MVKHMHIPIKFVKKGWGFKKWNVKYHDLFIDNKNINSQTFFSAEERWSYEN